MTRHARPDSRPFPVLVRLLWQWLALGAMALLVFPAARGDAAWLGWLPFWLLVAPATGLAVLHRAVFPEPGGSRQSRTPRRLRSSRRRNSPMMRRYRSSPR